MFNYKIVILTIVSICLTTVSCKKDFLDRLPQDQVTEANFYRNADDATAAIFAAYDVMQFEMTPAGHFRWFWGDIVSDDATKGGSGDNDGASLGRLERFEGRPTNDLLSSEWAADYQGIYRANLVLQNVPNIDMDAAQKNRILAEAKFIRAWFYYNLVTIFGDVPLVSETLSPEEYVQGKNPASEIWAQIETDLIQAIEGLPKRSELPFEETGRVTKGAAQGLLTKAHLYQGEYGDAELVAFQIIESQEYILEADYASIFTLVGENGSGSVFEIQYMPKGTGDWGRFTEGTLSNVFQRARGAFSGYGFNLPTQDLVDEYEPNDPRLEATIFQEGDVMGDRGIFTKEATGYDHDYYSRKFFISASEEAPTGDPNVNGPSNDKVIRYADVLLMYAEAAYQNGNEGAARSAVNQVRARARGTSTTILPDVAMTVTGTDLLNAIWHERRVELAMEGHRFFDLIRQGRAGDVMRAVGANFVDGTHELFPVPLSQIQATNGAITQNNGY